MTSLFGHELNYSYQGLHLITLNTPNGQKLQIYLEELKDVYGTEWTTSFV
jgi:glutathione S-transferase